MAAAARAYVGLGANLGDAVTSLRAAAAELGAAAGVLSLRLSPLYRSAPVDADGPDYVNAVAELDTTLTPQALLAQLQRIEQTHGRQRPARNAPRTLDLDLLLYGDARLDGAELILPHPRLHQRAFVLRPLADLAPALRLPGGGAIADLLAAVSAQRCERLQQQG